ncbi:MAG: hypothetical protein S4CHLAM2_15700 [Chlamydiales bacterium]|nr:hypothetical protein [Chlamydiales bacterium]
MSFLLVNLRATVFRLVESVRVVLNYYRKPAFVFTDFLLATHYLTRNPHQVSKAFMKQRGEKNLYTYGETPLTTLDQIARECRILSNDIVYELGCGPGRTLFWLRHFVQCRVVGVDYLPTFIERAQRVNRWRQLDRVTFLNQDMLETNYSQATVVYLYGTCLEDEVIEKLCGRLSRELKPGAKVITVSYPLTDYSSHFRCVKQFSAQFPWGKAEVFLNYYIVA